MGSVPGPGEFDSDHEVGGCVLCLVSVGLNKPGDVMGVLWFVREGSTAEGGMCAKSGRLCGAGLLGFGCCIVVVEFAGDEAGGGEARR